MHQEVLDKKTKNLLMKFAQVDILNDFYLAGGTSLALQLGHRQSIDLDWFNKKNIDTEKIKKELKDIGKMKVEMEEEDTLNVVLSGVKLSFFAYPYKLLYPLIKWQNINLADKRDIACMKLYAISSRGSKKDFIDFYFLLQEYSIKELLTFFEQKYQDVEYNKIHLLKSITYFQDADNEPMPVMLKEITWNQIKQSIQKKARKEIQ